MPVYVETTVAATGASDWIPLDRFSQPFNVGFGVTRVTAAASAAVSVSSNAYNVEHTFVDVLKGRTPAAGDVFQHSVVASASRSNDGNYAFPVAAIRLNVNVISTGASFIFRVVQAGL